MTSQSGSDPGRAVDDVVDALSLRVDLLGELHVADEPLSKRELVDRLGVSRSTVNRGLRQLRVLGFVVRTENGFTTTPSGDLVCGEYLAFADALEAVLGVQDLIDHLPPDAPLSVEFLTDAEVVTVADGAPHAPGSRVVELVEGADRVEGLARANATPSAADQFRRQIERGLRVELVFDREMFAYLDAEHDWITERVGTDRFTAWVHDAVPYGLFLATEDSRTTACLLVYDARDRLDGVIVNDADPAVEWAREVVEAFRSEADSASVEA